MPGESEIWLDAPPFHTVDRDNLEWFEQFKEPGQIDFAKAVIIGDFGPGRFTSTGVVYGVADAAVTDLPLAGVSA